VQLSTEWRSGGVLGEVLAPRRNGRDQGYQWNERLCRQHFSQPPDGLPYAGRDFREKIQARVVKGLVGRKEILQRDTGCGNAAAAVGRGLQLGEQ
jgi:hypothetical protein